MASRRSTPALASRVFAALLLVTTVAVVAALAMAALLFQQSTEKDVRADIRRECELVASSLGRLGQSERMGVVRDLELGTMRLTLVDPDGTVTFDSEEAATSMGNHRDRPEIALALSAGEGDSERDSQTLGVVSYYHAERLPDGSVVRVSEDAATALSIIAGDTNLLLLVALVVVLLSWAAARLLSRKLVAPILSIDPLADPNGSPYRELEPLVNRLNEQQATLTEQMDQLRDAEAMRQQFTANVTHELKTPIASISLAAQMMNDQSVTKSETMMKHLSGVVQDESKRLRFLVEKVLQMSMFDRKKAVFKKKELDLNEMVENIAHSFSLRVEHTGGKVYTDIEAVDSSIYVDEVHFQNVIFNLMDNAVKYRKPGEALDITMKTWNDDQHLYLSITDTGLGMKKENLKKIFDKFYRVHTGNVHDVKGFGLGLAYVKKIVYLHDGEIKVDSEYGKGTTFTIKLPVIHD